MSTLSLMVQGPLLAHAGGAPEVLAIGGPIVVLATLVMMERRARRAQREKAEGQTGDEPDESEPPP